MCVTQGGHGATLPVLELHPQCYLAELPLHPCGCYIRSSSRDHARYTVCQLSITQYQTGLVLTSLSWELRSRENENERENDGGTFGQIFPQFGQEEESSMKSLHV